MTRRRLRLPAAIALLAVAAPLLASPSDASTLRDDARQWSSTVRQQSADFGRRVAHGAREAGHQFHDGMHQAGHSLHRWWNGVRSSVART